MKDFDFYFFFVWCIDIDISNYEVYCELVYDGDIGIVGGEKFKIVYDKLVIVIGVEVIMFGIVGVYEYVIFLCDVKNVIDICLKLMFNFMVCEILGMDIEERKRFFYCVVVGGGFIGVEFFGEFSDFILCDV